MGRTGRLRTGVDAAWVCPRPLPLQHIIPLVARGQTPPRGRKDRVRVVAPSPFVSVLACMQPNHRPLIVLAARLLLEVTILSNLILWYRNC
jgi:hypothetical protein